MKTAKNVWVFDVDGVISNLVTKKINQPEILHSIKKKLELGEPVVFNTGRSLEWTIENIINTLISIISSKKTLEYFFAAGEKGGTWLTVNKNGHTKINVDESLRISTSLHEKIRNLIARRYPEALKEYETKPTMISFEMTTGSDPSEFKKIQAQLAEKISDLIAESNLQDKLRVDPTRIAIDVEYKRVGKGFAMERILNWLKEKRINPQKIITFGDSKSDFEMAEKAHEQGFQTEFIYVGGDGAFDNTQTSIPIINTKNKFEKGTLEFLRTL